MSVYIDRFYSAESFEMLNELNIPTLQSRRQKQRLIFFYKVVEGQVPAMPPDLFVKYQKSKRQIRAKQN
jgi:hypothetical protein